MSILPSTALIRYCLIGLLAVARVVCPCPSLEAANAAHTHQPTPHSCCDEGNARSEKHRSHQPTGHSHGDSCQHCGEQPQYKPTAGGAPEESAASAGDALALPANLRRAADVAAPHSRLLAHTAVIPPLTLWRIRTVVLLI